MVDPQLTSGSADKPANPTQRPVGANGLVSSEEEPAEGAEPQRSPAPLLERIRRDRQDLEAKIAKLRSYIQASSDMMTKLKDEPDMKERYETLSATRADLVQNAVNLQQLLVKLKDSENRASTLAGRERALAAETAARNESAFSELARELPPEVVAELDPEDRANYEKKRELLRRINQSQEKLRAMETEQQRLRMLKENVEWKLAEARANRLGLQEQAHELLHDMPGVHPAADATNWESTTDPDRSALESLNARVAALQSLPLEGVDAGAAQQLQERLQGLQEKRHQLDGMVEQLRTLQQQSQREDQVDSSPPAGDAEPLEGPEQWQRSHAAAMSGQRQRLEELERSVQAIRETLALPGQAPSEEEAERTRQEQERAQQLLQEQEQGLRRRAEQVEESRRQLDRLRQLMASVEQAHASGQRLSEAVPHQLTELLASVHQLDQQDGADDGAAQRSAADSQSQAAEYVELLRRLHDSVDSLGGQQPDQ